MSSAKGAPGTSRAVILPIGALQLDGLLDVPAQPSGIVIFAHGSGSSRHSKRNQHVASVLQAAGLATLLFDLLTTPEEAYDRDTAALRFDIPLLALRLAGAVDWSRLDPDVRGLPVGLFGASTGAAAALMVAADRPNVVRAVVSRGGRPDLAGAALSLVRAPTLLIVGAHDATVLALNERAARLIPGEVTISIVAHATHLFEEPGTLDQVAELASAWFAEHLAVAPTSSQGGLHDRQAPLR